MKEEIDGYRRTSVKTKDKAKLQEKLDMFHERGEKTKVIVTAGYSYIYVKKEKPLKEAF